MNDVAHHERTVGRYALFGQIGHGGMAAVHLGRRLGPAGFSRLVAIKRLHPHLAADKSFAQSFLDEARIAARVSHPNVVSIHDVVMEGSEALLVMEYVHGLALSTLYKEQRAHGTTMPLPVALAIGIDMLHGLHAAHEAVDERGRPLQVVHRDVSPQNLLVGLDGISRVLDFGIAKAARRLQTTSDGSVKGKLPYMPPERLESDECTRGVDVYAAGIVVWEMIAGQRYHGEQSDAALIKAIIHGVYRPLPEGGPFDAVLARAIAADPKERYATAEDFANALERISPPASRKEVTAWLRETAPEPIARAAELVASIEAASLPPFRASAAVPVAEETRDVTPARGQVKDVVVVTAESGATERAVARTMPPRGSQPPPSRTSRSSRVAPLVIACGALVVAAAAVALVFVVSRGPLASAASAPPAADGVRAADGVPTRTPEHDVTATSSAANAKASSMPRVAERPRQVPPRTGGADAGAAPKPPEPEAPSDRR